ncbi:MAG: F0F1 ATP synthase subunit epsilon [Rhodospirillaceae bacterium]|mgnify:FL=1|nr:F0F1 ATP synthase subunit epsilon [Rhodospirillaceae bacterium]
MAEQLTFELVSPERLLFSTDVEMVVVPGDEGDFGVLAGHAPLVSTVRSGVIDVYGSDSISDRIFVAGGFAEVVAGRCTVLAEEAINLKEVEKSAVEERIRRNEQSIQNLNPGEDANALEVDLAVARALMDALDG